MKQFWKIIRYVGEHTQKQIFIFLEEETHFCSSYLGTAPQDLQIKITTNKAPNSLNMFALSFTIFTVLLQRFFFLFVLLFFSFYVSTVQLHHSQTQERQELNNILPIFSVLYENDVTIRQFRTMHNGSILRITFWISRSFGFNCPRNIVIIMAVTDYVTSIVMVHNNMNITTISLSFERENMMEIFFFIIIMCVYYCTSIAKCISLVQFIHNCWKCCGYGYRFINFTFKIIKHYEHFS